MSHQQTTIAAIRAMRGPEEGELRVDIRGGDYDHVVTAEEAEQIVRDNPRIEFTVTERWLLN